MSSTCTRPHNRALRGGANGYSALDARLAACTDYRPWSRNRVVGLRLVRKCP